MSNDFARLMEASGVTPMGAARPQGARRPAPSPAPRPTTRGGQQAEQEPDAPVATPQIARQAWVAGATAGSALDVALQRLKDGDGSGWAIAILGDGTTRALPIHQGRSSLLSAADRMDARLVVMASGPKDKTTRPFTFVLHPQQGVATLDYDPETDA